MASRAKEDEKNERIIRGLLKLPENRRCINCNSLGPQYVCTNFWTFVCTNCSGIHREFTHRVKSVSMAKFTSQEVAALQEGGNQRAKGILFKEWDPQRHSFPDSSNVERLRDFIKHVYVERRFTGEKNFDKPPRGKMGEGEDVYENRRIGAYQGGSRSPPYEDTYERRYSDRSSPGGRSDEKNSRYGYDERRSPGYEESRQHNDYRRSPARPEVVNDWRREDRFGNGRKLEDHRTSDGDPKLGVRSPERPRDFETSSPPVVRPVREILGENVVPLRIIEPPKPNLGKATDRSEPTLLQKTASSSGLGSANGKPAEVKLDTTGSLIDFDADPEPPLAAPAPQAQITVATQSVAQPSSSNNENNWASFDFAPEVKSTQAASNTSPLEYVLSELSGPASVPGHISAIPSVAGVSVAASTGNLTALPITGASHVLPAGHMPVLPFNDGASATVPGMVPTMSINGGSGQWPSIQHQQPSLFPAAGSQSVTQQINPLVNGAPGIQSWNPLLTQAAQGPLNTPATTAPQPVSKPAQEVASVGLSEPSVEAKSFERKALPEDLFTATYPYFPARVPGWQTGPPPSGLGYSMQYNTAAPMPTFFQTLKSTNPFDLNSEPPSVQVQSFPSMASLQGALPSLPPSSGLMHTSSLGAPSPSWPTSQPSPYPLAIPAQGPSFAKAIPPRPYMVQPTTQVPNNMPLSGHHGLGGFGSEGAGFGSVNMDQQLAGRFLAPSTPQPFSSVGGNPFG